MAHKIKKLDTKFIGHHISSGGFIFAEKKDSDQPDVLLIENLKGEFWVPKGHIEPGENSLETAYREIAEEVGIPATHLTHYGVCAVHRYSFIDSAGHENTKEVHLHVFSSEITDVIIEKGNTEIINAVWVPYQEALEKIIPYSRDHLEKAKRIFEGNNMTV